MNKKSKKPIRAETDTGEIYVIAQKKTKKEKTSFVKLYTETVSELCKNPDMWNLPFGFVCWLARHTNFDGNIGVSKVDLERSISISHDRVLRLFKLAEKAELIYQVGSRGTYQLWAFNPLFIHKGDSTQRKRNADNHKQLRFEFEINTGRISDEDIENIVG